jgi:hypothetical protein
VSLSDRTPTPLDPIEWLRANPEMFFKSGRFKEETTIGLLIREAVSSGNVTSTWTSKLGNWIAVGADADWLDGSAEAFAKPTQFPKGGQNATRVEVLLTTFCDAVFTSSRGNRDDVRSLGRSTMPLPMAEFLDNSEIPRVIVFQSPANGKVHHERDARRMSPWLEQAIATLPERDREFENV